MFLSLAVYIITAFILYLLARNLSLRVEYVQIVEHRTLSFWNIETIVSILFFAIICGMRYNVGVDNLSYIRQYEYLQDWGHFRRESLEPGFTFIAQLFAYEELHFSFFMGFWAAIQMFFVYYALRNDRYLLPFVALFIILGPTFLNWTNGLRQCVAGCIFIYLIEFIIQRKFVYFCVGIIICSLIHRSAILLLPFYWVFNYPPTLKNGLLNVLIVIVCTIIGLMPSWIQVMGHMQTIIAFLGYNDYANRIDDIIINANDAIAWGPSRIGLFILDALALYYYPKIKKTYRLNKRFDVYFYAFFIGSCLFNLFANTSHIFLRPVAYFRDFRVIIVPICLFFMYKTTKQQWLYLVFLSLAFFYTLYSSLKPFIGGSGVESPEVYKFFFTL